MNHTQGTPPKRRPPSGTAGTPENNINHGKTSPNGARRRKKPPKTLPYRPTKEEIEAAKERERLIKEKKALLRKAKRERFFAKAKSVTVSFFKCALISLGVAVAALIIYISAVILPVILSKDDTVYYSYSIGIEEEEYVSRTYSESFIIRYNTAYVCADDIVEYCDFVVSGDADELRIILRDENQSYIGLTDGSYDILINGITYRLNAPVLKMSGSFYVPIDLFQKYISGLDVEYDKDEKTISVSKTLVEESEIQLNHYRTLKNNDNKSDDIKLSSVTIIYTDISFRTTVHSPTNNINEYTLPNDIYEATDPNKPEETEEETSAEEGGGTVAE